MNYDDAQDAIGQTLGPSEVICPDCEFLFSAMEPRCPDCGWHNHHSPDYDPTPTDYVGTINAHCLEDAGL